MNKLIFECSIDILEHKVGIKIYKEEDGIYSFTQSHYFQDESQGEVYRPGSCAVDNSIEGLLFKINLYKGQVKKILNKEENSSF